jgi:Uma2 family endonuclease
MQPTGKHEEIGAFLTGELSTEVRRLQLPYFIPNAALIKSPTRESSYKPNILIIDKTRLVNESLWGKYATITQGSSVALVVEVVSNNWRDDYVYKLNDYESLGIVEYWLVDYLGLGELPTVTICQIVDEEYQLQLFRGSDRLVSVIFPELNLTAEQVLSLS